MAKNIRTGIVALLCALLFALAVVTTPNINVAHAQTSSSIEEMLAVIQNLLAQIQELQRQLNDLHGELRNAIKTGLQEGMTDEDIRRIQEILATDPDIYPERLVTGYFGPLTRNALMRFQRRHELEITGRLDEDTRLLLEEYLQEKFGDTIPPGLLRAPGIRDKIESRFRIRCDNSGRGSDRLCKRLKDKFRNDDSDDSDDDLDDSDDDLDDLDDSDDDSSDNDDDSDDNSDDSDDSDDDSNDDSDDDSSDDDATSTDDGTDS